MANLPAMSFREISMKYVTTFFLLLTLSACGGESATETATEDSSATEEFSVSESGVTAKSWLADKGYDPTFGARPLRRTIQDNVEDKMSDAILGGDLNPGDTALVDIEDDEIVVKAKKPVAVA